MLVFRIREPIFIYSGYALDLQIILQFFFFFASFDLNFFALILHLK